LPLLVFHLCLLALIVLIAVGRMTYLKGQLELTDGTWFEGQLSSFEAGPWHRGKLDQIRFANEGFSIDYDPGLRRGPTRNAVRFIAPSGQASQMVIGDQTPLVVQGYRFYTSHNKGFAPTFEWKPTGATQSEIGSVHLPAYPLHEYRQAQSWRLPGSEIDAWIMLQFDENLLDPGRPDEFKLPAEHVLVLRINEQRWELQPGQSVDLPGGRLSYLGVRAWMGITVFYDWTIPWLLASALAATGRWAGISGASFPANRGTWTKEANSNADREWRCLKYNCCGLPCWPMCWPVRARSSAWSCAGNGRALSSG
jgi:cytochrome c biogenesis protein